MIIPGLIVLMPVLLIAVRLVRARRRIEIRSRLLEVLARATRRGVPLVPLLERTTQETSGDGRRLVEGLARRLGSGVSLSEALRAAGRRLVPVHVPLAIEAAEGTARLPDTLENLAEAERLSLRRRHRLGLVLLYPALVLLLLALRPGPGVLREVAASLGMPGPWGMLPHLCLWIAGTVIVGLAATIVLRRFGGLPGTRLLSAGRMLRTAATLLAAGVPLGDALRRAGAASGSAWLAWRTHRAALTLDEGGSTSVAWPRMGLPAFVRTRLVAAEGSRLVTTLEETARSCEHRHEDRADRFRRLLYPTVLLVAGVLVAVEFAGIFRVLENTRESLW